MLITDILSQNASLYGNDIALVERNPEENLRSEISWRQFDSQSNMLGNALISAGIKKGDKVIHLLTNCIEWLPLYFGILRTGAWAVPLNFRFSAEKIKLCTETSEARVFIFGVEFIERVNSVKADLDKSVEKYIFVGPDHLKPDYAISHKDFVINSSDADPDIPIDIDEEAALYFTSGTTGTPKAVLLTHRNLYSSCKVENDHHGQTRNDNFLCIPPLYHTGAKMHWFGNFIVGAKSVILKGVKPQWILEAVSEEKITIVWLLVPWAHDILIAIENGDVDLSLYELDQWRLMHIGAQPVPKSLVDSWKNIFPHHEYDTNYGLTESCGPGCVHLGVENTHKVGAIGLPGSGWEAKIVDSDRTPLPGGETGELVIRGPGIMKEYYKNPEETQKTIVDGWLYTGDVARSDESGFIWLVDRKKDVIITGGENIYPVEIEDFFMGHDKVHDIAVIGIPDERLGEISAAIIKVKEGRALTEDEVSEFAKGLPRYKRPRKIIFDDVPRNPTGKIEKPKLRRKFSSKSLIFKDSRK